MKYPLCREVIYKAGEANLHCVTPVDEKGEHIGKPHTFMLPTCQQCGSHDIKPAATPVGEPIKPKET